MHERFYRLIGKILAIIGMILVLFPVLVISYANNPLNTPSMIISHQGTLGFIGLIWFGLILTFSGLQIYKRYRKSMLFFIKDGGPIHSGDPWKKSSESGLFLTSCGFVLSINQESNATSHIGYKIVTADRTSCKDCALREGRVIIQSGASGRDGA